MKRILKTGIMVVVLVILTMILSLNNSNRAKYEFYDMQGKKGTSSKCLELEHGFGCEYKGQMILVSQYSEVEK